MSILLLEIERQKYNNKVILEGIVQPYSLKSIHGVLGENGAGKTTLFNCMANLIPFIGKPMMPANLSFGYIPTELYMYPLITGYEFLKFYITAKQRRFQKEEVNQLNDLFELPLNEYAYTYSAGMLKKLYLLGIILQHNDILLLDEPFNGLDFKSTAIFTALMTNLKEQGKTLFVASHDIDHLFCISDTISVIKDKNIEFYSDKSTFNDIEESIKAEAVAKVDQLKSIFHSQSDIP